MITITTDETVLQLYRNQKMDLKKPKDYFFRKQNLIFYTEILYSNNEIWEYTINKDSGELTAFTLEKK
jgi:hypothetical protein